MNDQEREILYVEMIRKKTGKNLLWDSEKKCILEKVKLRREVEPGKIEESEVWVQWLDEESK